MLLAFSFTVSTAHAGAPLSGSRVDAGLWSEWMHVDRVQGVPVMYSFTADETVFDVTGVATAHAASGGLVFVPDGNGGIRVTEPGSLSGDTPSDTAFIDGVLMDFALEAASLGEPIFPGGYEGFRVVGTEGEALVLRWDSAQGSWLEWYMKGKGLVRKEIRGNSASYRMSVRFDLK